MTPAGFHPIPADPANHFLIATLKLMGKLDGADPVFGFRVEQQHVNPVGNCHGGMLATFADTLLGITINLRAESLGGAFAPTVSLNLDFLAPAPRGSWVEGRATILRAGGKLIFIQGLIYADAMLAVRASGVFAVVRHKMHPLAWDDVWAALRKKDDPA